MRQQTGQIPFEASPLSEALERPGYFSFHPTEQLNETQPVPDRVSITGAVCVSLTQDGTRHAIIPSFQDVAEPAGRALLAARQSLETDLAAELEDPINQTFRTIARSEADRFMRRDTPQHLIGGLLVYRSEDSYHSGLFTARPLLLEYRNAAHNVTLQRDNYSRNYRQAPPGLEQLARIVPRKQPAMEQFVRRAIQATIASALPTEAQLEQEIGLSAAPQPVEITPDNLVMIETKLRAITI